MRGGVGELAKALVSLFDLQWRPCQGKLVIIPPPWDMEGRFQQVQVACALGVSGILKLRSNGQAEMVV